MDTKTVIEQSYPVVFFMRLDSFRFYPITLFTVVKSVAEREDCIKLLSHASDCMVEEVWRPSLTEMHSAWERPGNLGLETTLEEYVNSNGARPPRDMPVGTRYQNGQGRKHGREDHVLLYPREDTSEVYLRGFENYSNQEVFRGRQMRNIFRPKLWDPEKRDVLFLESYVRFPSHPECDENFIERIMMAQSL